MLRMVDVTEFMRDHIVDLRLARSDEIQVQAYAVAPSEIAPPSTLPDKTRTNTALKNVNHFAVG